MLSTVLWPLGSEQSGGAWKKQTTNFYGVLTTQSKTVMKVDNITIGGKINKIPVYEKPTIESQQNTTVINKEKSEESDMYVEVKLLADPTKNLVVTYLDLNEISQIKTINQQNLWTYSRKKYSRQEYVEIVVTPLEEGDQEKYFLIDARTVIYCDGISKSGPEEKKVPIQALACLDIQGFCIRGDNGKCSVDPVIEVDENALCEARRNRPKSAAPAQARKRVTDKKTLAEK